MTRGKGRGKRCRVLAIRFLVATVFAILFLAPTVVTVTNSFMSTSEITYHYSRILDVEEEGAANAMHSNHVRLRLVPEMVSFKQYASVLFRSPDYLFKFWNSVILTVPIVVFQIIVALLAAYGFSRFRGRRREVLFFSYIILMLMPFQVTLVPNYMVAKWLGVIDTRWAIILPAVFSPFAVFLLTKYMRRIPETYIEAAKLDGAGDFKVFAHICLPLCKTVVASVAILIFIDYWNMVEQPLILLSDADMHPLSVFLSQINMGEIGIAFAASTVYMVPCILIFLYGEEYLVEGIVFSGGIKG